MKKKKKKENKNETYLRFEHRYLDLHLSLSYYRTVTHWSSGVHSTTTHIHVYIFIIDVHVHSTLKSVLSLKTLAAGVVEGSSLAVCSSSFQSLTCPTTISSGMALRPRPVKRVHVCE